MLGSFLLRVKITQSHVHHIHVEFSEFCLSEIRFTGMSNRATNLFGI